MRWLLAPLGVMLWIGACAESSKPAATPAAESEPPAETTTEPAGFQAVTAVYRCTSADGEVRLVTRTREHGLHVFLPPDATGGYLDCEHDRRASIWEHAKLNGVDFRAVGNEPGWVLEIREGERLDLSYDYGQRRLSVPVTDTSADADKRITTLSGSADGRAMTVRLSGGGCSDTMSDETYPTRVEVEFDDRVLSGCGRPLH